jgi:hypothetical protein
VPDGSKTAPQTSDSSWSGPTKRRNGETVRSGPGVINPISMLPPSSQTKISPASLTVTLSTASSEGSGTASASYS